MTILDADIVAGRKLIGVPYKFCTWGGRKPLPSDAVLRQGICCTEFLDLIRRGGGKGQIGGTPDWERFLSSNARFYETFAPASPFPFPRGG